MSRPLMSPIVWKMAWRNIRAHPRQTFLSVLGGCIGAALIVAAVMFFQSFEHSGSRWLEKHYGAIDWELLPPAQQPGFDTEQLTAIREKLAIGEISLLPAVTSKTTVAKLDGQLQQVEIGLNYLIVGVDWQEGQSFDPSLDLWNYSLTQDQVVLSEAAALPLNIQSGDTISLTDTVGVPHMFKVKAVVKEEGITGYRGLSASEGTVLMNESSARKLAGVSDGVATSIFASANQSTRQAGEAPRFPTPYPEFSVVEQKQSALQQVEQQKLRYGITFAFCSVTAIGAGMLLMMQLLLMLGDSRKESFGVLRALGYQRKHIQHLFFAEASLLSLLSTGMGVLLGIPAGYLVVGAFQWFNRDFLLHYSAHSIPIEPYLSPFAAVGSAAVVFGLLMFTSLAAGWRLGRMNILTALRGEDRSLNEGSSLRRKALNMLVTMACLLIVLFNCYFFISGRGITALGSGSNPLSGQGGWVFLLWILGSVAFLYVWVQALPLLQKLLKPILQKLGFNDSVQMMASRYPARNYRRTLVVALLFSSSMMVLSLITVMNHHLERDMQRNSYTLLGYPAYIKYNNETEKNNILSVLQNDSELSRLIFNPLVMEPYMLRTNIADVFNDIVQLNVTVPTEDFIRDGAPKLTHRAPEFVTDEEAWLAVMNDPKYIVLDKKYSYGVEEWPGMYGRSQYPVRPLAVGETLQLDIYSKPAQPNTPQFGMDPEKAGETEITIAGFADVTTGMEFYNVMFIHEQLYNQYKEQGYRWEYLTEQGYVMLPLASSGVEELRALHERLTMLGINGFNAPLLNEAPKDFGMVQMIYLFVGFLVLSVSIGLAGLCILQYRAVQERAKTIAMLRCIGFGKKMIRQMLLLEGTVIGWSGLLNGLLFGTMGGYYLASYMESTRPPIEEPLAILFPWLPLMPIIAGLLAVTLLLNLFPSRRVLRLTPGEAIRSSEE